MKSDSLDVLDDRIFLFIPNEDWSRTTVHELDIDGEATARFEVDGIVSRWVKLR